MKSQLTGLARRVGVDIRRYSKQPDVRTSLIQRARIDTVLDVGANAGQYARALRDHGFEGRIISFEPLTQAFTELQEASAGDPRWDCVQCGLGSEPGTTEIHIAGNSWSSSVLPMEQVHVEHAPESAYVGSEAIEIRALDSVAEEFLAGNEHVLLKMDTQGYEMHVLRGGQRVLPRVCAAESELSLAQLYSGQPDFVEVLEALKEHGLRPLALEPEFVDYDTGFMLQMNGFFIHSRISG